MTPPEQQTDDPTEQERSGPEIRRRKSLWRWLWRVFITVTLLLALLIGLAQLPVFQNWLAQRVTRSISETLETRVELDYIRLSWLDQLRLEGLFVEDIYGDTLLYSGSLYADINLNPFVLLTRGFEIEALDINDTRFKIRRDVGDSESNLEYALQRLFPPKDTPSKPINLNLRELNLQNVLFAQTDSVRGQVLEVLLAQGHAALRTVNLPGRQIDIKTLELDRPFVRQVKFAASPLDSDTLSRETIDLIDSVAVTVDPDTIPFIVRVENIELKRGRFTLDNFRKEALDPSDIQSIDFAHLFVDDIDIDIEDFQLRRDTVTGVLHGASLTEQSGFVLERLAADELLVSSTELTLNGLQLRTPYSRLGDSLSLDFRNGWDSWIDFENEVRMDIRFDDAKIQLRDIMYFVKGLRSNEFFRDNRTQTLVLEGQLRGRVNNLSGRDVLLTLSEGSFLRGNFSSRNLAVRGEEFLNLRLEALETNVRTLRRLIPSFRPPANFDRLGRMRFSGRFDGFFSDFVAEGSLRTSVGRADLDMRMNLKPGVRKADYAGNLELTNFDLGTWTSNPDFGLVSFRGTIKNGIGLVPETASAEVTAELQQVVFRGYNYQNATINGQLNSNFFNGNFAIQDDNIDFNFLGELDFRDTVPEFDFDARIQRLDLKALNLSKEDLVLSGKMDLNLINTVLSKLEGNLRLDSFTLVKDRTEIYQIDSVLAYSTFNEAGRKVFRLESDVAEGEVVGDFDLDELTAGFKQFLLRNYPGFSQRLKINPPRRESQAKYFDYDITIKDSKGLNYLLSPQLGIIKDLNLRGGYDGVRDNVNLKLDVPGISFGTVELRDLVIDLGADGPFGELEIIADSIILNEKTTFGQLRLTNLLTGDSIKFGLTYAGKGDDILDQVHLNGLFSLPDSVYSRLQFDRSDLVLFQERWNIGERNSITFGNRTIDTRDFILSSGDRTIRLEEKGETGLTLLLNNFSFGLIDTLWKYEQLDFSGKFNVTAGMDNVFKQEGIKVAVRSDTFRMNGDDYGWLSLDAQAANPRSQVSAYLSINQDTSQITAEVLYNPADLREDIITQFLPQDERKGYLDLDAHVVGYPLSIANYWVGESVSGIEGVFNANMRVKGQTDDLDVSGFIEARRGAFTIDFLKTRYRFDRSFVTISDYLFDVTGTVLRDKYDHRARLIGGVTHTRLKDLGLDMQMKTDRFLALDLEKGDNDLFYGRALGKGSIEFSGNFRQTDIYVNATVGDSSLLVIPIDDAREVNDISGIRFVNKRLERADDLPEEELEVPTGVSLDMDIVVTDQAVVEMVFDEQVGDVMRGRGRGNLRILVPRNGDFQMFGDYNIEDGNYLFTFYNVINKDFRVKRGGRIVWNGSPFDAQIDIQAEYKDLRAPLLNFVQEYLVSDANGELLNEAGRPTDVDLTLFLSGQLLKPEINFNIDFPNLRGQLQTYANNKKRLLTLDQNELNRQVFGLIVVGQFLPGDLSFGGDQVVVNTVSEWLSNYVSLLVNGLLADAFGENNFLSDLELDFAYNQYRTNNVNSISNDGLQGQAFEVTARKSFLNGRLSTQVDFNYLNSSQLLDGAITNGAFLGNEVIFEYAINKNRTLKLRVYQRRQPDIAGGRRLQVGSGISWRREFDNFGSFFRDARGRAATTE